jgi:hypothetical protein
VAGSGGEAGDDADGWLVFASTESDEKPEGGGTDQPPADDVPPPNSDGVLDAKALRRGWEFDQAQKAYGKVPKSFRDLATASFPTRKTSGDRFRISSTSPPSTGKPFSSTIALRR